LILTLASKVNRFEFLSLWNSNPNTADNLSDAAPKRHFYNPCITDIPDKETIRSPLGLPSVISQAILFYMKSDVDDGRIF